MDDPGRRYYCPILTFRPQVGVRGFALRRFFGPALMGLSNV